MQAGMRLPHIFVCDAFILEQYQGDNEWELDGGHSKKEGKKGLDDIPQESDARSEEDLGQFVYLEGGLVDDIEVESQQPAPDNSIRDVVHAACRLSEKEFETYCCDNEQQRSCILRIEEYFPAIQEDGAVEAWYGFGPFGFRFIFFWLFVVFGGDNKELSTGSTAGTFARVFAAKGN